MNKTPNIRIFISHNSKDKELASALIKLLRTAMSINNEEIRCTSVPGYGLSLGADTDEEIKKEVKESEILIGLLTPNSLQSSYVLFELGARWAMERFFIPILSKGADFSDLPDPIRSKNAIKLDQSSNIHDLLQDISDELKTTLSKVSVYQKEIDLLLAIAQNKVKKKVIPNGNNETIGSQLDELVRSEIKKKRIEKMLKSEEGVSAAVSEGKVFVRNLLIYQKNMERILTSILNIKICVKINGKLRFDQVIVLLI